jgi:hypothetical protein
MPDDVVGLEAPSMERREHCEARGNECRLLDLCLHEIIEGSFETKPLEIETGSLAPFAKDLHGLRHRVGDLLAHARFQ